MVANDGQAHRNTELHTFNESIKNGYIFATPIETPHPISGYRKPIKTPEESQGRFKEVVESMNHRRDSDP